MKEIEIPKGYEARIEGNKVVLELKESEDERIRKELIDFVNHYRHNTELTAEQAKWCKKAIVYLEKQKEQKPIVKIPKFRVGDTIHLKSSNAEYTIEAISSSGYHGKGWSLTFDAEPDYELVQQEANDLPSNLDEAAEEYLPESHGYFPCGMSLNASEEEGWSKEQMLAMFKAGAEWAFGQGETVGTYVDIAKNDEEEFLCVLADVETFKKGDKVVVQIRKVNEKEK